MRKALLSGASAFAFALGLVSAPRIASAAGADAILGVARGGCGGHDAVSCRAGIGAAASGANADITGFTGLSAPLSTLNGSIMGTPFLSTGGTSPVNNADRAGQRKTFLDFGAKCDAAIVRTAATGIAGSHTLVSTVALPQTAIHEHINIIGAGASRGVLQTTIDGLSPDGLTITLHDAIVTSVPVFFQGTIAAIVNGGTGFVTPTNSFIETVTMSNGTVVKISAVNGSAAAHGYTSAQSTPGTTPGATTGTLTEVSSNGAGTGLQLTERQIATGQFEYGADDGVFLNQASMDGGTVWAPKGLKCGTTIPVELHAGTFLAGYDRAVEQILALTTMPYLGHRGPLETATSGGIYNLGFEAFGIAPIALYIEAGRGTTYDHVAGKDGAGGFYTTDSAGYAPGATSITLASGNGVVLTGSKVTFAGDANIYTVTSGRSNAGTITLQAPGLINPIPAAPTVMTSYGVAIQCGNGTGTVKGGDQDWYSPQADWDTTLFGDMTQMGPIGMYVTKGCPDSRIYHARTLGEVLGIKYDTAGNDQFYFASSFNNPPFLSPYNVEASGVGSWFSPQLGNATSAGFHASGKGPNVYAPLCQWTTSIQDDNTGLGFPGANCVLIDAFKPNISVIDPQANGQIPNSAMVAIGGNGVPGADVTIMGSQIDPSVANYAQNIAGGSSSKVPVEGSLHNLATQLPTAAVNTAQFLDNYTLSAGTLAVTGQGIKIHTEVSTSASLPATTKFLDCFFGTATIRVTTTAANDILACDVEAHLMSGGDIAITLHGQHGATLVNPVYVDDVSDSPANAIVIRNAMTTTSSEAAGLTLVQNRITYLSNALQ